MSRILVTGGTGQLGTDVVAAASAAGHEVDPVSRSAPRPCDITDADEVARRVEAFAPDLVIHTAAWTAVDDCEADPARALLVNGTATGHVARAAAAVGAHLVNVSTDYVFDGTKAGPYTEHDAPNPVSAYGRSKLAGEHAAGPDAATVRISWVCGAHGANMVKTILRLAAGPGDLRFVDDQRGCPTFTADVAPMLLELGLAGERGVWHVTNQGAVSWFQFARAVLTAAGHDPGRVHPIATADLVPPRPAPRPANSVLANERLAASGRPLLRRFEEPLAELVAVLQADTGADRGRR